MIGMNFWAFLVLLVAGLIAAVVIHYVIRYRFLEGWDGFLGKWMAGWLGAWLGSLCWVTGSSGSSSPTFI